MVMRLGRSARDCDCKSGSYLLLMDRCTECFNCVCAENFSFPKVRNNCDIVFDDVIRGNKSESNPVAI